MSPVPNDFYYPPVPGTTVVVAAAAAATTTTTTVRTTYVSWQVAPTVKNWRILLQQSFTARMPLLMATMCIRIRKKTLEFSSTVLPAPSPCRHIVHKIQKKIKRTK